MVATTYGGWVKVPPSTGTYHSRSLSTDSTGSTGSPRSRSHMAGLVAAVVIAGTGGSIDHQLWQQYEQNSIGSLAWRIPLIDSTRRRTPAEDLGRIRQIFSPAISELAKTFSVSRQAVYNWIKGELPKPEHREKLEDFANAADLFAATSIQLSSAILKRPIVNRRNLFQVAQNGGSIVDTARLLIQVVQRENEQRARLNARLAGRKTASRSVEADFPAPNDLT